MNLQDFLKLIRARWISMVVAALAVLLLTVLYTLTRVPLYEASTRLYVSTSAGQSASELYQGNRLSQDRVLSYTELLTGKTLAQRTIDKLDLEVAPEVLQSKISAAAKTNTVLIDVKVLDESPVRARDIANALSDEFVVMVRALETPDPGAKPDARVIVEQRASVPSDPSVPDTKRNIALGLVGGIFAGGVLALARDRLDNTVKSRETLEEITGVGLAGSIPLDKDRRRETAISFEGSNTGIAESFRKLRTNLQFLSIDHPPRLIVITSSTPAEGKSTTSVNIALALAEAGYNVVLVDGDMRRPTVHKYLGLVGSVGFSTVLSGSADLTEVLQATKYPRLTALAAGASPPNPSEMLGSQVASRVLSDLRAKFDYVIIDSPPLLAVTDGAILATQADGAILMVRFGKTKRDQLAHAVGSLRDVGASLLGAVFSMTPTRGSLGSYAYSYAYYGDRRDGEKQADVNLPDDSEDRSSTEDKKTASEFT